MLVVRFLLLIIFAVIFNSAYSSCIPEVNKTKPKAITGGQFDNCEVTSEGQSCDPTHGEENYMSRHHIFDKHLWVDVLNRGLNEAGSSSLKAQKHIQDMLKAVGAPQSVINNLNDNNQYCSKSTNSWLTWLPVNLSLGPAPQDRSFDPGNDFDNWALIIVPSQYQSIFEKIETAVVNYDSKTIAENLAALPIVSAPWPMFEGNTPKWVRAYDTVDKVKYCPREVFEKYGTGFCPNSDVSLLTSYNLYSQAA